LHHHDDAPHDATLVEGAIDRAVQAQLALVGSFFRFRGSAQRRRSHNQRCDSTSGKKGAA
jgi:hypothetical protein